MLLQTLERHSKRVQEEESKCEKVASAAEEKVFAVVMNHLEDLQTMLVDGRYGEMEAQLAKAQAFARKRALKGQLFSLKELSNTVAQISRALFGEEGTRKIRGVLGFKESQDTVELNPTTFQIHQTPIDIPVVYRRIFQDPSLEARDMLTGREKDIERLQKHLMGQTGSPSRAGAVLFEGATNGGALLQAVARGLSQDIRVVRHSLKATTSIQDVQEILQSASGGCLVLVEDLRFLVKLEAGGLEPLRQLVEGILEDNGKNAWMVSCEQSSWDYLHHHIPLEGIFPERIHVGQLSTLELRRAILERHGMSGFSLEYEEMESSVLWRFGKRLRRQAAVMDANEPKCSRASPRKRGHSARRPCTVDRQRPTSQC